MSITIHRIHHGPEGIANPSPRQIIWNVLRRTVLRTRHYGLRSGAVCLYTHLHNFWLRALERLAPTKRRACPCCGWTGRNFRALDLGQWMKPQVECPGCLCHERHRMLRLVWERHPPAFAASGVLLHFAPEASARELLERSKGIRVVSVDIDPSMLALGLRPYVLSDLHNFAFADNCAAGALNVHVMEHLRDDRRCLGELLRVLRPGGTLVLMAPFDPKLQRTEEWGAPNPEIFDHWRNYSAHDFEERLAGFDVEAIRPAEFLAPGEAARYGIDWTQIVHYCRKPS